MASPVIQEDALRPPGPRSFDLCQNGVMWHATVQDNGTTSFVRFVRSTNNGSTWAEDVASSFSKGVVNAGWSQGFKALSFFIDKDDYAHVVYRSSQTVWSYRRGTPNAGRTSWTWSAEYDMADSGVQVDGIPDVVAHREGTGWWVHVFYPDFNPDASSQFTVSWKKIVVASDQTITVPSTSVRVNTYNAGTTNTDIYISADFRHEQDDAKVVQSSTPSLYVAYGDSANASPKFKKILYSGGNYFLQTERNIDTVNVITAGCLSSFYDGTRVVIAWVDSTTSIVECAERDEADTTTTARNPSTSSGSTAQALAIAYGNNADIWIFYRETGTKDVTRNRYNRGGATWDGWSVVDADTVDPSNNLNAIVTVPRSGTQGLSCIYNIFDNSPDITKWESIFQIWGDNPITLQGVATVVPNGNLTYESPGTVLQAVTTVTPNGNLTFSAPGTLLQAVATLEPKGSIVPKQDYTVYDAYLESPTFPDIMGLMYYEDEQTRPSEVSQALRPPRQDVGNEDTEIRPESGETFSQTDFSHGAGQLYFHHEGRDVRKYLWSEGFDSDIDTVGETALLEHLNATEFTSAGTFDWMNANAGRMEIFNGELYVILGTLVGKTGILPGGFSNESPHDVEGAVNVNDLASDGQFLYAALGANGIHRRNTSGTWSHWSDTPATRLAYVKSRIMAASDTAIYEVISAPATPTAIETLPTGWKFQSIFEASGFIYAAVVNEADGLSRIHTYGLNSGGTAIEKKNETPAPRNQLFRAGMGYLGLVFLGGGIRTSDGGYDPVLYEAIPDASSGALTYQKLAEGEGAGGVDLAIRAIIPLGENIVFGYSLGAGFAFGARDGLGMYKLKNGAFVPYLRTTATAPAGRAIRGLIQFGGRVVFVGDSVGLWSEDPAHVVASATLWSSVADWQTTAEKIFDLFQVVHEPLPAGTSCQLFYTTAVPSANDYHQVLSSSVAGDSSMTARIYDVASSILGIKLVSNANSARDDAPSRQGFFVRANVIPDQPEYVLNRYVRLVKKDRKDEGGEDVYLPDVRERKADFQGMAYKWVTLYEPGVIWTVRVTRVANVTPFLPIFEETSGEERHNAYVIQLVLEGTRD